jgi:iron complex transport system ATP-binding protein
MSVAPLDEDAFAVENVSFGYDAGAPVLRDVSFTVNSGEFLSIIGPNGSGKTTLLRLLDRILIPHMGRILLENSNLQKLSRSDIAKRIAFVPQDGNLSFPFTVYEVVLMGRSPHIRGAAFESQRDREIARIAMQQTDVAHIADQPITRLSGGERQRALIARALAQEPDIVLLDEPNAHLDIAHQLEVFRIIKRLNTQENLTVVSVSHDLNLAAAFSDRVAMLMEGELSALGTPREVFTEEQINTVFRTRVLIDDHPSVDAPRVTLISTA